VKLTFFYICLVFFTLLNVEAASQFTVKTQIEENIERGQVVTYFVESSSHRFSFVAPRRFRNVTGKTNEIVALGSQDGHALVTVNITDRSPGVLASEEVQRSYLADLYPKSKILTASPANSMSAGRSFEVQRIINGNPLITKHMFFPYESGTIEIVFTMFALEADQQRTAIRDFLISFKVEKLSQKN
jgi:hypothetical protein